MIPLLPPATARGSVLARLGAWHTGTGRRIDGPLRWAVGVAAAAAIMHAVIFAVGFAIVLWERPVEPAAQAIYAAFWLFVAGIAGGVQLLLTFVIALPIGLLAVHLARVPRSGALIGALVGAALLSWVEPFAACIWIALADLHGVPVAGITGAAALLGLVWGTWLPRIR